MTEWIRALAILSEDPSARVRCPVNGDADLQIRWLASADGSGRGDVELRCPACGAAKYALAPSKPSGL